MPGFDDAWKAVAITRGMEQVSSALRPLLRVIYEQFQSRPLHLGALKTNLQALLAFLATDGRTSANCWAVDLFFAHSEGWEQDWTAGQLPDDIHDVIAMMGEALHDAVDAPGIAENFGCLPEQLLDRVNRTSINAP